jgi:alanine racemase
LTSLTKHALRFLEQQNANTNRRRTLIVSDIDGDELVTEMFYTNLQQAVASGTVDRLILVGQDLSRNKHRFSVDDRHCFHTEEDFLSSPALASFHNEALLLKIAPSFMPDRILSRLQLLAHDTVLQTDFDAMFHNMDYVRTLVRPETRLMCMIKASAYGSGSIEVAQAMQHYGCHYLGVAFVNEGIELRQAGVRLPVVVLNPMRQALHRLFEHHLEPAVGSFGLLQVIIEEAQRRGLTHYPIHIKLDTGMHRAGFASDDLNKLTDMLVGQTAVKVVSVFSHLAAADERSPEMNSFTLGQIAAFETMSTTLMSRLGHPMLRHILNTAGIEHYPEYQYDMVRLGIGLWGVEGSNPSAWRNVCTLSTRIMQLKTVPSGETVGYNRRWTCRKETQIALLPVGYADGIDRRLSNGVGAFRHNGRRAPIIGNVCMDLLMIDVTGLNAQEGDEVVLFDDNHSVSDIAAQLGTISYEVLTSISPRVRRVYFRR